MSYMTMCVWSVGVCVCCCNYPLNVFIAFSMVLPAYKKLFQIQDKYESKRFQSLYTVAMGTFCCTNCWNVIVVCWV